MSKVTPLVGTRHVQVDVNDRRAGVSSVYPKLPSREGIPANPPNDVIQSQASRKRVDCRDTSGTTSNRKSPRLHPSESAQSAHTSADRPLLYEHVDLPPVR